MKKLRLNFHHCNLMLFLLQGSMQTRILKRQRGPVAYFRRILINECTDDIE
jgi:hypothetical protein